MPTVRKIKVYRIRLANGRELVLEESEAIAIGDALVERALMSPQNQRRLAFGDIALSQQRPDVRKRVTR